MSTPATRLARECAELELRQFVHGVESGAHLHDILLGRAGDELVAALVAYARQLELAALGQRDVAHAALAKIAELTVEVRRLEERYHTALNELRSRPRRKEAA